MKKPKAPAEPKEAAIMRERQIADLAALDEEENVRIKRLFRPRAGARAFRAPTAARNASNTAAAAATPAGGASTASAANDAAAAFNASNPFGIGF
jgi:hypothetical protein